MAAPPPADDFGDPCTASTDCRSGFCIVTDDAHKDATHWTGTGTGNLSYSCNNGSVAYPIIYWARCNGSGMHILAGGDYLVHGFVNNSEDLDVWIR